ncbi:uncharacterized protein RCC_10136 [Ramularia collo-cygni]|uniref:C3H1-type domain-containing protein n=1 Tax=Ramularia collo-cygni TaxID=112498 RepID=A0A2D3VJ66_9PEZI|nr:uncharacterized protein RCC_10136 [Ramularia collo-cygni]CZT24411.1 uncharacterized protein RCC_10136 [Ramularia collo-cygni]
MATGPALSQDRNTFMTSLRSSGDWGESARRLRYSASSVTGHYLTSDLHMLFSCAEQNIRTRRTSRHLWWVEVISRFAKKSISKFHLDSPRDLTQVLPFASFTTNHDIKKVLLTMKLSRSHTPSALLVMDSSIAMGPLTDDESEDENNRYQGSNGRNTIAPDRVSQPSAKKTTTKVCWFWYHKGSCVKSNSECKFLHELDPSRQQILAWHPSHPQEGCGLALCPMKDGRKKVGPSTASQTLPKFEQGNQKRKFQPRHPDAPAPEKKAKMMDYDDEGTEEETPKTDGAGATCFFWYHGNCARDPCPRKHELVASMMVQPPPGYVHKNECSLEWCPGDAPNISNTKLVSGNEGSRGGEGSDWHLEGFE